MIPSVGMRVSLLISSLFIVLTICFQRRFFFIGNRSTNITSFCRLPGKPIYSRHGDQNLINGYIGIIQTIISFFEGAKDPLMGFTAGRTRFVISTEGSLYFVAISRLAESDSQLRGQLEALYMQILSTLTLPTLTHLFTNRPNTDLRRPLEGTENLLSSLADTFTKGSPSALLSALECLKIRKSQRHVINSTLLKTQFGEAALRSYCCWRKTCQRCQTQATFSTPQRPPADIQYAVRRQKH